ncbi:hypothetical protein [Paenibacillus harenae]|nr:hypothetical protein [Paenibacillus harenae]
MIIVLSILAVGCSNTNDQTVINQKIIPQKLTVISESQDKLVSVLADTNIEGDLLDGITLKIRDQERKFQWKTVSNPTYYPIVLSENIDNDPDNEVVVILTTGYGTGMRQSQVHILKQDFTELSVDDPLQGIKRYIKTSHVKEDGKQIYSLALNNRDFKKEFAESEAGQWFDDIVFGNIIGYRVQDKHLIAELPAQVSPGLFLGTVEAEYQVKDQELIIGSVTFSEEN